MVIHPQSVIHGLVTYHDGSVLAHLGIARHAHADRLCARLARAHRRADASGSISPRSAQLTFEPPDERQFPGPAAGARGAASRAAACPTVLNAANETAVHAFLDGRIGFLDIAATVEETLTALPVGKLDTLDDVYAVDRRRARWRPKLAARRARNHPATTVQRP